jgi:gentisate 1,2-dioxygenase
VVPPWTEIGDLMPHKPRWRAVRHVWAHPGLLPVSQPRPTAASPVAAYRCEHTDAALRDQLDLEEGQQGVVEPGHAAVRYTNPATGRTGPKSMAAWSRSPVGRFSKSG